MSATVVKTLLHSMIALLEGARSTHKSAKPMPALFLCLMTLNIDCLMTVLTRYRYKRVKRVADGNATSVSSCAYYAALMRDKSV